MKSLNKKAVQETAERLMDECTETTTLDVKTDLRGQGYKALQREISDFMRELADENDWNITNDGNHRSYSLPEIDDNTNTNNHSSNIKKPHGLLRSQYASLDSISSTTVDVGDWEVDSIADRITLYFEGHHDRDHVRQAYASQIQVRFHDTRSRRVKND